MHHVQVTEAKELLQFRHELLYPDYLDLHPTLLACHYDTTPLKSIPKVGVAVNVAILKLH